VPTQLRDTGQGRGRLQFVRGPDGRSQLTASGDLPGDLASAYGEATGGRPESARQRLAALEAGPVPDLQTAFLMGQVYYHLKDWASAERWFRRVLDEDPQGMVFFQLAEVCTMAGRLAEAAEHHARAFELDPDNPYIAREHATDLMRQGRTGEAMRIMRSAVDHAPDNPQFHSHYLMWLSYLPDLDPQEVLDEHLRWADRHAPRQLARQDHANDPDPDRRLRIGYLCSEFRNHATVHNFEPFLDARDSRQAEVFGYGSVGFADQVTERLKAKFDAYRDIRRLDDRTAADLISQDQIDILVVIGGHVPDNRLRVLAYRPAPIQVEFGAVATTGMSQIDYRFTDRFRDSPQSERWYVERPVYLPGFDCYQPSADAPPTGPLPAPQKGFVTFACFNNSLKITPALLGLWSRILATNKSCRLLLKFKAGEDQALRKALLDRLAVMGVDPGRVEILGWLASTNHLALYNQADIALDTHPFGGFITTLEALWMGVPVVSRVAERAGYWPSRTGLSHLQRVGLEYFAATTDRDYVAKALALAQNLPALAKIRQSLRARMTAQGGLCDAKAYMAAVESAYRQIWKEWCMQKQRQEVRGKK
jgi:predicted O-linked N-acetylglucosamine transferase (SPINDLY family)